MKIIDRIKSYILKDSKAVMVLILSVASRSFDLFIERGEDGGQLVQDYKGDSMILWSVLLPPVLNPTGVSPFIELIDHSSHSEQRLYTALLYLEEKRLLRILNRRAVKANWSYTITKTGLSLVNGYLSFLFMDAKSLCVVNELT